MDMKRLPGTDLWVHRLQFPDGSRIEYKFGVVRGNHEEWVHDPANPFVAHDPFGGNSVVHCVGYSVPEWTHRDPAIPQGTLLNMDITSRAFGDHRTIRVWLPPGFREYRRYRLLLVHDGDDYMKFSNLGIVIENLMSSLEIPAFVVALTNPHDRLREYANDPRHASHLVEEVLPELEKRFPLIREASGRCLMGASFGGVASLSTAWR
jgi:enterochelin esterase family protein